MEKQMIVELKADSSVRIVIHYLYAYISFPITAFGNAYTNCSKHTPESAKYGKCLIRPAVTGITPVV